MDRRGREDLDVRDRRGRKCVLKSGTLSYGRSMGHAERHAVAAPAASTIRLAITTQSGTHDADDHAEPALNREA